MAGHSKWANIEHRKARQDSKRSKIWSKCARALIVAAKNGGGDPATNLTLRYAIDEAKSENMPKDTITNAIKKGSGEGNTETYEGIIYEGYGPNGVAVLLEILTDNRNRTASEIRKIFERANGNLGTSGCVAYIFTAKGQIFIAKEHVDEETIMDLALEAGADDVSDEDEAWLVSCEPSDYIPVREAIKAAGIEIASAELTKIPDTTVTCVGSSAEKVLRLMDTLEDQDDVQKAYANFEIDEEELAKLEAG
ncbi:MAG: YebC/PmpR family DNA-binding transcriptional regulator [Phycisphaeraceae bacterium]|nr:YebC/PmpR family DNA-binding transcriptional regulator [Phycisphaeraceae bacterium]